MGSEVFILGAIFPKKVSISGEASILGKVLMSEEVPISGEVPFQERFSFQERPQLNVVFPNTLPRLFILELFGVG